MMKEIIINRYGGVYWWLNDELHRENGPAETWFGKYGEVESWYLSNRQLTKEEVESLVKSKSDFTIEVGDVFIPKVKGEVVLISKNLGDDLFSTAASEEISKTELDIFFSKV